MKICVCGKGGSGKSNLVTLLSWELRHRGRRILVVDSDESNSGLYWMLGFDEAPVPLMELAGGKRNVKRALRGAFTESGDYQEKPVLARDEFFINDLPPHFVRRKEGISLVCVGKIHQVLEGCACPMGVLCREFLKKLRTVENEVVIVDMEAGVEHFGRGVETSIDAVVAVVEPSLESVNLAERIMTLSSGAGARFAGAVLNKVNSEETAEQLSGTLQRRGVPTLGAIPFRQEFVTSALKGTRPDAGLVVDEISSLVEALLAICGATTIL